MHRRAGRRRRTAAGCVLAAAGLRSSAEVIGVEVESYSAAAQILVGCPPSVGGATIAEGIAVSEVGALPISILRAHGVDVVTVPERLIERAVILLIEIEKTVAEGAGAAALAALLAMPERFAGRKVGLVLSGGNIDTRMLANVLMRGLVRDGRLIHLTVEVPDRPGALAISPTRWPGWAATLSRCSISASSARFRSISPMSSFWWKPRIYPMVMPSSQVCGRKASMCASARLHSGNDIPDQLRQRPRAIETQHRAGQ